MIAVICAMKEERDAIVKHLKDVKIRKGKQILYHGEKLDNEYYVGKLGKKEVVVSRSGVGTLYASLSAVMLIEKFKPDLIISTGVAGSLNENVHVGDIVVGKSVSNWRIEVPGWDRNEDSVFCSFKCDDRMIRTLNRIDHKDGIHVGHVVAADEFIYKKSQTSEIRKYYPNALCGEMEGYAVAGTAYAFNIPVCIIYSISDETLVSGNFKQFDFNLQAACERVADLCKDMIRGIR